MSDDETVNTDETKEITLGFRSPASRAGAVRFTGRLLAERCLHERGVTGFSVYETCSIYESCGICVLEWSRHLGGTPESDRHSVWLAADLGDLTADVARGFGDTPEVIISVFAEARKRVLEECV